MKRTVVGLLLSALVLVACGTAAPETSSEPATADATTNSEAPAATEALVEESPDNPGSEQVESTDPPAPESTSIALVPDGPAIPSVTLELDDGTSIVLAEHARPIMLVFWAEW